MTLDLTNPDRMLLKDLPDDVRGAMFNAWLKGDVVECVDPDDCEDSWDEVDSNPGWFDTLAYRIRPEPLRPTVIPDAVWAVLPDKYTCAAQDPDGRVWACSAGPCKRFNGWYASNIQYIGDLRGVQPGTVDWRVSLQQRPKGV